MRTTTTPVSTMTFCQSLGFMKHEGCTGATVTSEGRVLIDSITTADEVLRIRSRIDEGHEAYQDAHPQVTRTRLMLARTALTWRYNSLAIEAEAAEGVTERRDELARQAKEWLASAKRILPKILVTEDNSWTRTEIVAAIAPLLMIPQVREQLSEEELAWVAASGPSDAEMRQALESPVHVHVWWDPDSDVKPCTAHKDMFDRVQANKSR